MYYGYPYMVGGGINSLLVFLVLILAIATMIIQGNVTSTFNKYAKKANSRGYTGAEVAEMLLRQNGITDVTVEAIPGSLTDHYDPKRKVINLSQPVYGSRSVSALGVAAHETGHAIQHAKGYVPLTLRSAVFPVVNFSSKIAMPLFIIGIILASFIQSYALAIAGALLFSAVVFFQLVTLPVEFNASARALKMLDEYGYLVGEENREARKVLTSAALTYVAAAAASILQLLRLLAIISSVTRRRD